MNFFNFGGATAEIDIILSPPERDRMQPAQQQQEYDQKNGISSSTDLMGHAISPLYYDGETVAGRVVVKLKKAPAKLEHHGIRVEFVGQIEMYYDRGNHHEFIAMEKMLARPGELTQITSTFPFEFAHVEKPYETYFGANVKLRYFVRATVARRITDLIKEQDILVHSIASYPDALSEPIKMEVGIEESLHIEFEYSKSKYHLKDVIIGKIYFLLVRVKIKYMELSILRKELTGYGASNYDTAESVIARYEIMDGAPVRGESIPIRLFLSGYPDLTPTMKDVQKKFSVRYFLNLVLVDEEDRRYFKQQEVILWRKGEKLRRLPSKNLSYGVQQQQQQQYDQQYQEQPQQRYMHAPQHQQQHQQNHQPYQQPVQQQQQQQQPVPPLAAAGAGDGEDFNINAPRKQIFVGTSTSQGPAAAARQKAAAAAAAAAGGGSFSAADDETPQQQQERAAKVIDFTSEHSSSYAAVGSATGIASREPKSRDEMSDFSASSSTAVAAMEADDDEIPPAKSRNAAASAQQKFERFDNISTTAVVSAALSTPAATSPPPSIVADVADENEDEVPMPRKRQSQPDNVYVANNVKHAIADSDTLRASPPPLPHASHSSSAANNNRIADEDDDDENKSPEKFAVPVMPPSSSGGGSSRKQKNFYSRNFDDSSDEAAGAVAGNNVASSSGAIKGASTAPPTQRVAAMNLFGDDADDDE